MIHNELINYKCMTCDGTGRINCDCDENSKNKYNKNCLLCSGEGSFKCPLCEGKGIC